MDLSHNIPELEALDAGEALAALLLAHSSLRDLSLAGNAFTSSGIRALASALFRPAPVPVEMRPRAVAGRLRELDLSQLDPTVAVEAVGAVIQALQNQQVPPSFSLFFSPLLCYPYLTLVT